MTCDEPYEVKNSDVFFFCSYGRSMTTSQSTKCIKYETMDLKAAISSWQFHNQSWTLPGSRQMVLLFLWSAFFSLCFSSCGYLFNPLSHLATDPLTSLDVYNLGPFPTGMLGPVRLKPADSSQSARPPNEFSWQSLQHSPKLLWMRKWKHMG